MENDWLLNFEKKITERFPAGLEIEYEFGKFNIKKFRIEESFLTVSKVKRLVYISVFGSSVPVICCDDRLREDISRNIEDIVVAFKEKERRQERINERVEKLDLREI